MSNIHGKAYALNTISPMQPWKTYILRLFFWFWGIYTPLGNGLKALSFIHFARWVIVPRHGFPWLGEPQPKNDLRYDYLLFFSNFNGTWNQYIDAFSSRPSSRCRDKARSPRSLRKTKASRLQNCNERSGNSGPACKKLLHPNQAARQEKNSRMSCYEQTGRY